MPPRLTSDTRQSLRAHEIFLSSGHTPPVRGLIADSWVRSAAAGVAVEGRQAPILLAPDVVRDRREQHPLARVFPLLYDVLGRAAEDCDSAMAIADAQGHLLWVCGLRSVLRKTELINFVEGACWDEAHAGTKDSRQNNLGFWFGGL